MNLPEAGHLLISDPFLRDPNFIRTVVLLCEHNEKGSFGLVLNRPFEFRLDELMDDMEGADFDVYTGGPVQQNTLHFIHMLPEMIPGGQEILPGVYWGGDFAVVKQLILAGIVQKEEIRFFIGYSGWSSGQLLAEMSENTWLTTKADKELIFQSPAIDLWKLALKKMGGPYVQMINYPIDPQLN